MHVNENTDADDWKPRLVRALSRIYPAEEVEGLGAAFCKAGYQAGRDTDSDALLMAVRDGEHVAAFMQIGCCLTIGADLITALETYLNKLGKVDAKMVAGIVKQFLALSAEEFADGHQQAVMILRSESTEQWRSFRAEFGSAAMVGPGEFPRRPSYEPSLN